MLRGEATSAEQAEFDNRLASDETFCTLVDEVSGWLEPFADDGSDMKPSSELLSGILSQLDGQ